MLPLPALALALAASPGAAPSPLVHSEPISATAEGAGATAFRAAIASAHCAVLHVAPHPKRRIALAARICLRPGLDVDAEFGAEWRKQSGGWTYDGPAVVEERGVVDLGARRFTFVRAPFIEPSVSFDGEPCGRESASGANDAVSRALRSPPAERTCLFDRSVGGHGLWVWQASWPDDQYGDGPIEHALVTWSASGRFVALHWDSGGHWKTTVMSVSSVVVDTRTLAAAVEPYVYVPRFRGDVAEVFVAARWPAGCRIDTWDELLLDDVACDRALGERRVALQAARVDFATAPPRVVELGRRYTLSDAFGWSTRCDDDAPESLDWLTPEDWSTFPGNFDRARCRREAKLWRVEQGW